MTHATRLDAYRNTLRASMIATFIAFASLPLEVPRYGFWPLGALDLAHGIQALVLAVVLVRFGKGWSTRVLDALFVFLVAPYFVTLWLPPVFELMLHGHVFEPLLGHHFLMLALAMLSPSSYRLSVALIAAVAIEAMMLAEHLHDLGGATELTREPAFTLLFAGIALAVQWSAFRRRELAIELTKLETRSDAQARTTRLLLALRDRANSPLQTLEIGVSLLERRNAAPGSVVEALRGALTKLVDLQRSLCDLDANAPPQAAPRHLDVEADVETSVRELRSPPRPAGDQA